MKSLKHLITISVLFMGFLLGTVILNSQNNQSDKNEPQTDKSNQYSKDFDLITLNTSGSWTFPFRTLHIDNSGAGGNGTWDWAKDQPGVLKLVVTITLLKM